MGKQKYLTEIWNLFEKSPVVDFSSIERIVKDKKNIKQYAKQLVRNLLLKNKIIRLTKGYYTSHDDISLAVFCFAPSYLGIQNALSFHNLWEQETVPTIISSNKIRAGIRSIYGLNIVIRRISPKYLFGFDYYEDGDFYLPYSDIEKTFIDMVYFKEYIDKEVIKEFRKKIDKKKLKSYLRKYPIKFRKTALEIYNPKH
jgi:predicted transcriptional regulator of viral defense system